MYTSNGTLSEVVAYIDGFEHGRLARDNKPQREMVRFGSWLAGRPNWSFAGAFWRASIQASSSSMQGPSTVDSRCPPARGGLRRAKNLTCRGANYTP